MAAGSIWIVGTATEVGELEERLADADATVRETWPGQPDAGVVALVEAGPAAAEGATSALHDAARFDDADEARVAAAELAARQ